MTFLNGLLALGALAFSIPLIIHLLHRSRFVTIDWGAWHLLDSVIRTNQRRMQVTNLLLLLLRCLIPILLAFCLARPVLTGFQSLPGDAPRSLVIALDDSRSMLVTIAGKPSRFDQAKQGLKKLLSEMSRRDEVILLTSTNVDAPPITTGPADAISRLKVMRAQGGPVDLGRLTEAAVDAAEQCAHAQCGILVLSDFQSANVSTGSTQTMQRLAKRVEKSAAKPTISFWNFTDESDAISNLSVDAVEIDSPAVVAGRTARFSARIRNSSENPARDLRVIWSIDGVALAPRKATVDAKSTAVARLSHRIETAGVHEVTVAVEHGDALADDNRRAIAVDVMREIKVVIVDGRPSNKPLEGQGDFLAIALSPFAFGGDDQPDAVNASVIRGSQVAETLADTSPEIVILANVGSMKKELKQAITSFVLSGGSLVVFDGDRVDPDDFNEPWNCDLGSIEFPARLGDIEGTPGDTKQATTRIGELNPMYTPWKLLALGDQRPLSDVEVQAYRKLSLASPKTDSQEAQIGSDYTGSVLLRMSSGDPLVVSAPRGRGQVFQFAVPCNASWSMLPLRMIYLPMMQQMVLDLAGRRRTTTLTVGQPLAVSADEFDSERQELPPAENQSDSKATGMAKVQYTIEPPGGNESEIDISNAVQNELLWSDTHVPGVYRFRRTITSSLMKQSDSETEIASTLRVVEVPEAESQLRTIDAGRLESLAKEIGGQIYTNLNDLRADDRTRRFGREIWRWLLAFLLIAMIAELYVQQRLVGRRNLSETT